jgi:hypothetical protein
LSASEAPFEAFWLSAVAELSDLGWQLESRQTVATGVDLRATRIDDLGVVITLQARCLLTRTPAQLADVDALREELRRQPGVVGALVARAGFSAEARQAAREHGIVTWDARRLTEALGT